ncbi:MAG TPA: transcription elongation factor GreA [Gammaproteobacteria bacterium]|nr:transcription elongation factor GreA [Gammaproteobacteria bacterium]
MTKIPMTTLGEKLLREELNELKTVTRHQIIAAISEARAHGDLKENAEYAEAKNQQSFIEGRIQDIEHKLSHAQIIDVNTIDNDGKIVFGATVTLLELGNAQEVQYQIVGEDEADIKKQKISYASPVARAIIGKYEGDEVSVQTPKGLVAYEIVAVEYK